MTTIEPATPQQPTARQHLISTKAAEVLCWCGATIISGLDEGLTAKVDPWPLDSTDEIRVLLDNRRTYSLSCGYLTHRTPGRIRFGLKGTIHAQHRCAIYKQPSLIGAI